MKEYIILSLLFGSPFGKRIKIKNKKSKVDSRTQNSYDSSAIDMIIITSVITAIILIVISS